MLQNRKGEQVRLKISEEFIRRNKRNMSDDPYCVGGTMKYYLLLARVKHLVLSVPVMMYVCYIFKG